ncbi:hypothetical protein [Streptomyces sp. NPDC029674]|uniref:hypothetical protein n=1 Tax=Streptomyces sp. NPDC029674 TaxID=3365297 RepID=UPI00384B7883
MNNSKRMLTALTLFAAAVATAAPAHAAAAPAEEGERNVGHVVGETLMDPTETGRQVLDGGKTALNVVDMGMESVRTSTDAAAGR